jgi:glycosyltransferase involved in cell wall biosynthesis
VGGNREIVHVGSSGLVVAARSAEGFARAIPALADAPDLRARLGAQARRWVERHGSLEGMARRYEAVYAGAPGDDAVDGRSA